MKVKICGIRTENDLHAAVSAGCDMVGFLLGQVHASHDFILPGTAARLVRQLSPAVVPVLVTHYTEPADVFDLVVRTGITTVQLHGGSTPGQVSALRDMLPPAGKIILMVHLATEDDFIAAKDFYRLADAFLIDSVDEASGKVGGTGITNDWNLAAKFIKASPLEVFLSGGLCADNVAQAIQTAHPHAVDANSKLKNANGAVDTLRCEAFVRTAKS